MRQLLKSPAVNAICISIFTAFYALIFIVTSRHVEFDRNLYYENNPSLWQSWSDFLSAGHQIYIAWVLISITMLVAIMLVTRRRPYDEYHTSILMNCLVVAFVMTLMAIAIFYFAILSESAGIVEKFTLFIAIHWTTVVLSDLAYVLLCRWR